MLSTTHDWLSLLHAVCLAFSGLALVTCILCGLDDLLYGAIALISHTFKRIRFCTRKRLTLDRLRAREQQRVAIFVPSWRIGARIVPLLGGFLDTVDYRNFTLFVGVYTDDAMTRRAVEWLANDNPRVVIVLLKQSEPKNDANTLNNLYQALKDFERRHEVNFDIIAIHDAEDRVHPQWLSLVNYLMPRVDMVQIPRLVSPVPAAKWTQWLYADELAEFQLKNLPARESMHGFIPQTLAGCAVARRAFVIMEEKYGVIFDETAVREGYRFAREASEFGLRSVFVSVALKENGKRWFTLLSERPNYIACYAQSSTDFVALLQGKTRQITGAVLQEWWRFGWREPRLPIQWNLLTDRKELFAAPAYLLAMLLFGYVGITSLGRQGLLPWHWPPITSPGLHLLLAATAIVGLCCALTRGVCVALVYGVLPGLLALPRMLMGNLVQTCAAACAVAAFLKMRTQKLMEFPGFPAEHITVSLLGESRNMPAPGPRPEYDVDTLQTMLQSPDVGEVLAGLEAIPHGLHWRERHRLAPIVAQAGQHETTRLRAAVARISGFLRWPQLATTVLILLYDPQWVVRANAARALLKFPDLHLLLAEAFQHTDRYAREVLIRTLEQDTRAQERLLPLLALTEMSNLRTVLLHESPLLSSRFAEMLHLEQPDERITMN